MTGRVEELERNLAELLQVVDRLMTEMRGNAAFTSGLRHRAELERLHRALLNIGAREVRP